MARPVRLVSLALAGLFALAPATASAGDFGGLIGDPGYRFGGSYRVPYSSDGAADIGPIVSLGLVGLTLGTILGGTPARADDAHAARCSARYRSYDPATDTWTGRDGRARPCRL